MDDLRIGGRSALGDLVARAIEGDGDHYNQLVERMSGVVWRVMREIGVPDVEACDIAQTVWLRLVEHLATIRDPDRLPGWLATTTRNECFAWIRGSRRRAALRCVVEVHVATMPEPDEQLLADERRDALVHAFVSLAERERQLLTMLSADPPVPYRVISDTTGIPIASIGPTRARCLEKLRRHRDVVRVA